MPLSRMPLALLPALALAPATAGLATEPLSAEQAMINYRQAFKSPREIDCPTSDPAEIVVCGRPKDAPDPNRAPLPIPREPGARIPGELLTDGGGCISRCHQPMMIDAKTAARIMRRIADRILHGE